MPDPSPPPPPLVVGSLPYTLLRAGLLGSERYLEALRLVRDDDAWRRWGQRALLALAVGQILAGIVFFFAFNWAEMPPIAKLGVIQAGNALCVVGAWIGRRRPVAWEAFVTAAATLVGVLLAVFGQIYQTGADAYTLFVGWALLILPWVAMAQALVPWVLWLAIVGVGATTYAKQIALPMGWIEPESVAVALAGFYAVALAAREAAARHGWDWLRPPWPRRLLVAAILAVTFTAAAPVPFQTVLDRNDALALAGLAVAIVGLGVAYQRLRDFASVVLAVLAASLFLTLAGFRLVVEIEAEFALIGWFGGLAVIVVVFGAAVQLLKRLRDGMAEHG